ncbi:MAG: hypothetical protein DRH50_05770, partial [Deltaproteobacteria bacterium]
LEKGDYYLKVSTFGPARLVASDNAPSNGQLSNNAVFDLEVNNGDPVTVTVTASSTSDNTDIDDLIDDINTALGNAGLGSDVIASRSENKIVLSTTKTGANAKLVLTNPNDTAANTLHFADGQTDTGDEGKTGTYELFPAIAEAGDAILDLSGKTKGEISLASLEPETNYLLRVTTPNLVPTIYELNFNLVSGQEPVTVDLATRADTVRKDVILGGQGNDVLQGGMGEDWIFGGTGNDVLSGGFDRQAPDLLFGQAGDDTFQLMPDELPLIKGTDQTFVPTFVDTFFGGDGDDRVLFLGGDIDNNGRVVPDFVAIRYNRFLQRYEFTSLVWDKANQAFLTETLPGAVLTAQAAAPENGSLYDIVETFTELNATTGGSDTKAASWTQPASSADGWNNNLVFTASQEGAEFNDVTIKVIDGAAPGAESASYDAGTKTLTVKISAGVTTANTVIDLVNDEGTFTASLNLDDESNAIFKLEIQAASTKTYKVTVTPDATADNTSLGDLAADINDALKNAIDDSTGGTVDISDKISAGVSDGRLTFTTSYIGRDAALKYLVNTDNASVPETYSPAAAMLGFADDQTADSTKEGYQQTYIFYQAKQVERTVIDTRAGDDVVHGDPEYKFPNVDSEWGIKEGSLEQNGLISALEIYGGDGNDKLFGGAYDDRIFGGPGIDFIAGGPGGDYIDGGPGADLLAGGTTDTPDDYELVTRAGSTGTNSDVNYASLLPVIESGDEIDGLTFHEGDQGDWYIIRTPDALKEYGESHQAFLSLDMISVVFDRPDMQALFDDSNYSGKNLFLFAAEDTDPTETLSVLPVEQFSGVPEYYLLHVHNVRSFYLTANSAPASPLGRLTTGDATFALTVGDDDPVSITIAQAGTADNTCVDDLVADINTALDASALAGKVFAKKTFVATGERIAFSTTYSATLTIDLITPAAVELGFDNGQTNAGVAPAMGRYKLVFSDDPDAGLGRAIDVPGSNADTQITSQDLAYRPCVIPLGDINGDGYADFIAAVNDNLSDDGPSYARIYFGRESADDFDLDDTAVTLKLTAPVLYPSTGSTSQSFFADPGDYNGDGIDDIAIAVTLNNGGTFEGLEQAVYILFGQTDWSEEVDVFGQADVAIVSPETGTLSVANAGDLDNDGYDDLLIGQNDSVYLFYGEPTWSSGTEKFNASFTTDDDNFTVTGDLWHRTDKRGSDTGHSSDHSFYFGRDTEGDYDAGHVQGSITSPDIDLTGVSAASFSFNYFLETEGLPDQYDKAFVLISSDNFNTATSNTIVIASNATTITAPEAAWGVASNAVHLTDPTTGWQSASVNIPASFLDKTIKVRFYFDSIDDAENNYEGWYVDDVKVVERPNVDNKDAEFTVTGFSSVSGVGDFNGDGYEDFAILDPDNGGSKGEVYIFDGSGTKFSGSKGKTDANLTFQAAGKLASYTLRSVGNINRTVTDTYDDFVITSSSGSYLITGRTGVSGTLSLSSEPYDNSRRLLFGAGDINGDGMDDLGAVALEESPKLGEDGSVVVHSVGQLFLGRETWGVTSFAKPDMVFEQNESTYQESAGAEIPPRFFDSSGDVNGDGKVDVALAENLGRQVHIYRGDALADYVPTGGGTGGESLPVKKYVFELATPTVTEEESGSYTGVDLSDTVAGTLNMNDAFALEGGSTDEGLAYAQNIGDFDGDGTDDLLVSGDTQSYIFLGPVDISGLSDVKNRAEYIIDVTSLGVPALKMGDVNADGKSDLAFIRHDQPSAKSIITVIFGGRVLPRKLTFASLDPIYTRTISLDDAKFNPANTSVYILNWTGGVNAITQQPYHDVAVLSSMPGDTNSYGYIFSGKDLDEAGTGAVLDDGSAAVELQLFTTTLSSNDIPTRIPKLEDTIHSSDVPVTFPGDHTFTGTGGDIADGQAETDSDLSDVSYAKGIGLSGEYYNGRNFDGGLVFIRTDSTVNFNWGTGSPGSGVGSDNFSIRWSGYLQPRVTGTYKFSTVSDDGVRLYLDTNGDGDFETLINKWYDQGATRHYSGNVTLNAGQQYAIKMEYYEHGGAAVARLYWRLPGKSYDQIIPQESLFSGLRGDYYNNKDFTNLEISRTDSTIDFNWGYGSPDSRVGSNTFSVRWTGYIEPSTTGNYQFRTYSDDGVRVFLDLNRDGDFEDSGETLINNWTLHGGTWDTSSSVNLSAGYKYPIKMEYFENYGYATAKLQWSGPGFSWTAIHSGPYGLLSPDPGLFINDNATASSTIPVSGFSHGDDKISDVNVTIDLDHTYDRDLDIYLVSPAGTRVHLADRVGGSGDNFHKTTLDDSASTSIHSGSAPFTGTFKPAQALSAFNGESPNGDWTLEVADRCGADQGWLNFWSLDIETVYTSAPGVTNFTQDVSGLSGTITDVDVKLNITHPNVEDLDVYLKSPTGTEIELFTDIGGSGDNFTNTILDAGASINIADASAPFTGRFLPEGGTNVLNSFDGENPNGTWTLKIEDDATGDTGTLDDWELTIRTDAAIYSEIEVEDLSGQIADLNLSLDITHQAMENLDVSLLSPGGTEVVLISGGSQSGSNFLGTFDDEATHPVGNLTDFDGLGTAASRSFALTGSHNDLLFVAKESGSAFNDVTIKFADGAVGGGASAFY